jgi:hypothetical protein
LKLKELVLELMDLFLKLKEMFFLELFLEMKELFTGLFLKRSSCSWLYSGS